MTDFYCFNIWIFFFLRCSLHHIPQTEQGTSLQIWVKKRTKKGSFSFCVAGLCSVIYLTKNVGSWGYSTGTFSLIRLKVMRNVSRHLITHVWNKNISKQNNVHRCQKSIDSMQLRCEAVLRKKQLYNSQLIQRKPKALSISQCLCVYVKNLTKII